MPPKPEAKEKVSNFYYNLHIHNLKPFSIEGHGLKSTWKGDLAILGNNNVPIIDGEWGLIAGAYRCQGKLFQLNQGTISLKGEKARKSSLYVVANTEVSAAADKGEKARKSTEVLVVDIEIIVKGMLDDLSLAFAPHRS